MSRQIDSERISEALSTLDLYEYGDVLQCMRCGLCLPTCPTYRTDGLETQSPRGRVAMIKAVIDGDLPASKDFIDHMYHCLDCRNCQTVCPAGVKAAELILEARAQDRTKQTATVHQEISPGACGTGSPEAVTPDLAVEIV